MKTLLKEESGITDKVIQQPPSDSNISMEIDTVDEVPEFPDAELAR